MWNIESNSRVYAMIIFVAFYQATHVFLLDTGLAPDLEVQALARVRRLDSPGDTTVN